MPLSKKSKPRLELQAAATYQISSSENVIEVIKDQPKRRGRPPKGTTSSIQISYNPRSKMRKI
jgi:hypothetical protein